MNDCSRGEGVRWVDNYLVGFSHAAQDFGLDAKVPSDFDIAKLDHILGVQDSDLHTLPAKDQCVVGERDQLS